MSLRDLFDKLEDGVSLHGSFRFDWTLKGIGFGQFYFYEKDGKVYCNNEYMSKEYIKRALCAMVDQCELTDVNNIPSSGPGGEVPNFADGGSIPPRDTKRKLL